MGFPVRGCLTALAIAVAAALPGAPAAAARSPLDPSFGNGGVLFPGLANAAVFGLAEDGEGRVISSGQNYFRLELGRYLGDGALDPGFGGSGIVATSFGGETRADAVAVQRDGKVLAAGSVWSSSTILARFEADGTLDTGFGERGVARKFAGRRVRGRAVAIGRGGRILVAGLGRDLLDRWTGFVDAYRPNGTVETHFGDDGRVGLETAGKLEIGLEALAVRGDGRILAAGTVAGRVMVVRLRPNGRFDRSFSGDGIAYFDPDGSAVCACSETTGMALDGRGRIVVAAYLNRPRAQSAALLRLRPDGRLDRSFGHHGVVRVTAGSRLIGHAVAIQRNRKIVLAGDYNVPASGEARLAVVRFRPDGRLDRSFGHRGFLRRDFGVETVAYAALAQRDGRVVVAGRANRTEPEGNELFDTAEGFLLRLLP